METILHDPKFWVAVSFIIFVLLVYKPVGRALAKGLDERSARIAAELEEATRLRQEAQQVLDAYKAKQAQILQEAEEILSATKMEAKRMQEEAKQLLAQALEHRTRIAQDKIAQAETKALQDVQEHVVDIAVSAAKSLIADHLDKADSDELIQLAIQDIERKVH